MHSSSWCVRLALAAALAALVAASPRNDQDFEFDDDAEEVASDDLDSGGVGSHARRPRRYVYDPHNSLCRSLVCKKREVCVLRDAFTALCATKRDILRRGDLLVAAGEGEAEGEGAEDDVFYEGGGARCVGCPARARPVFLCGSDNRTYSSLCRLDLHNCVRRAARPVRLACRGFCPCRRARRRPHRADVQHNEVLPERAPRRRQGSEGCALDKMANRLLDWFSVLMDEAGATAPPVDGFPSDCKPEVRWMFAHLDTDGDGLLSPANLYALRHDERERCLRPFLAGCGGARVTRGAWCACLRRAARPCSALARAHPARGPGGGGQYVPACDARGYYRPRQCHAALAVCWCVDPHGVELPGSRTKGAPSCPGEKPSHSAEPVPLDAEGAPADDEDGAGSGDAELHF